MKNSKTIFGNAWGLMLGKFQKKIKMSASIFTNPFVIKLFFIQKDTNAYEIVFEMINTKIKHELCLT